MLAYLLARQPGYIIADNPLDNLDTASQVSFTILLQQLSNTIPVIQLANRFADFLPFIENIAAVANDNTMVFYNSIDEFKQRYHAPAFIFSGTIPPADRTYPAFDNPLVKFTNVTVQYEGNTIVQAINWQINKGEFWQLAGPNGVGKTTLLTLITGDNPKAYGQNILLFGRQKGSGESVWGIKQKIGYFTSSVTDLFSSFCTVEQMVIAGFYDSVGLYVKPSGRQIKLAQQWLSLTGLITQKNVHFYKLPLGRQRMVMVIRAMVKHPPLLILDEPMAGLDDNNAAIITALINKMANESETAILYVSHRKEAGLFPRFIFELTPGKSGSTGNIL